MTQFCHNFHFQMGLSRVFSRLLTGRTFQSHSIFHFWGRGCREIQGLIELQSPVDLSAPEALITFSYAGYFGVAGLSPSVCSRNLQFELSWKKQQLGNCYFMECPQKVEPELSLFILESHSVLKCFYKTVFWACNHPNASSVSKDEFDNPQHRFPIRSFSVKAYAAL